MIRVRLTWAAAAVAAGAVALVAGTSRDSTAQQGGKAAEARYSHDVHAKEYKVDHRNCKTCHALDEAFNVMPPLQGKDHAPCANSGCHAEDFFSKTPKICGVCHEGFEPWKKQTPVARKRFPSEFGRDISHATHAKGGNESCQACHGDPFMGTAPKGGHATCASCHGKTAEPAMGNCADCHGLGVTQGATTDHGSEWAVGPLFSHRNHGRDPRTSKETDCQQCHQNIAKATKVAEVINPPMRSCDGCHDGRQAFKTTGFGCYRCHGAGK